jgi:multiple sugar transport system permease protein
MTTLLENRDPPTPRPAERPNSMRTTAGDRRLRLQSLGTYVVLLAVLLPFLFPIYWLATGAFKPGSVLLETPPTWWPAHWTLDNFRSLLHYPDVNIGRYALNTLYVSSFSVVAALVSSSVTAYGFARIQFRGRSVLFGILIGTLILPTWTTLIPQYIIFQRLGWLGTFRPLTWPYLFGDAFTIFLLRQFMMGIPRELTEAAKLDGANEFTIFWRIILPLMRPALAVGGIFVFINTYNDFFGPLIYLTDSHHYTLSLAVFQFVQLKGAPDIGAIVAFTALVAAPLIILFALAQRMLLVGIKLSGLRG